MSRLLRIAVVLMLIGLIGATLASPANAAGNGNGAIVIHPADFPDCAFFPGDVPGVNVFFPAKCSVVIAPSGEAVLVAHAQLPPGFALDHEIRADSPCFFGPLVGTGQVIATPSGQVSATCHFKS